MTIACSGQVVTDHSAVEFQPQSYWEILNVYLYDDKSSPKNSFKLLTCVVGNTVAIWCNMFDICGGRVADKKAARLMKQKWNYFHGFPFLWIHLTLSEKSIDSHPRILHFTKHGKQNTKGPLGSIDALRFFRCPFGPNIFCFCHLFYTSSFSQKCLLF